MADDVSFKDLLGQSIVAGDPFLAAACHPYADPPDRMVLEEILFATPKLKRQFAGAAYTPVSVLDSLAADGDERIRLRVAKHSATSPATLVSLARGDTVEDLYVRIASHRNTPRDMLEQLYKKHPESPGIRRALCDNPNTPGTLMQSLALGATPVELKGLARNVQADNALLRRCWEQQDVYLQAEVAAHPACPPELRDSAELATQALVRRKLAQNPTLSEAALVRLLSDTEPQVRAAAVRHLSVAMMSEVDSSGCDPSRQVRRNQARHRGLPLSWINRLARDGDSWVRRLIARNQTTPEQTLYSLSDDIVMEVRRGVARNPACPDKLLEQLARDPHPWVRAGVGLRNDIAGVLIVELSRDNHIDVISALGKNPNTPLGVLDRITHHENRDVRRAVILNGTAPRRVLCVLLEDPYPLNRVLLAGHGNLGDTDLLGLLNDPEPSVRFAGAQALAARLH